MKQLKYLLLIALLCMASAAAAQPASSALFDGKFNFYIANDLGRNGYYDQKPIAERMGVMAEEVDPEFIAAPGDIHHFDGVRSVSDPLWMTNYELIYSHPELMIAWHPVLGNHEYRGNTQAVLDYAGVSRRWEMPARYYTRTYASHGTTLRVVWLDTTPMMDKYRNDTLTYPDAGRQDLDRQLAWTDSVLTASREQWVIVLGHHPVYAQTKKEEAERTDMQQRLDPILRRHRVDMYVCGHIHNFQHIRRAESDIDYVVNSSASLSRRVKPVEGTLFCSPEPGFSIVSADAETLSLYMIDKEGKVLHTVTRRHKP